MDSRRPGGTDQGGAVRPSLGNGHEPATWEGRRRVSRLVRGRVPRHPSERSPLFAQSPPSVSTDLPASATPAMTAAPGPTTISPTPVSRLGPGSQAIAGSGVPTYKLLRYDEDYSYLKDPDRRTDFWDPIKYIPFGDREDWYASFGAQLRPRFQFYNNFDFGTTPAPTPTSTSGTIFTAISTSVRTSASSASS